MCPTIWFYLAEIYRIQDEHPEATLSMLADGMNVSLQAASRMIRRMAEEGLILHEPYKGFQLTEKGARIALQVLRRHRLLEMYLVRMMGFGWHEVHDMTENLERGITDKLAERMAELAGNPTRCPHGEPIPSKDGVMPVVDDRPLADWPAGEPGRISRVKTHNPEKLLYLESVNLIPGTQIEITGHSPFEGPVHLKTDREHIVLGNNLASEIYVEAPTGPYQ